MASPVDTSVKFFHSGMTGLTLPGTAGSLITLLDAVLVNGFGSKAVDAGGTIAGGVCRLPFSSGVSAADINAVIQVTGATPAGLNGEQKVTNLSSSWVEFATDLPDGAVTGSVSFKIAPLGWAKVFTKTNVAVYRPSDPAGTRPFLRVDDTGTTHARVTMYEVMTDVDTGINLMPLPSIVNGGYYWWKRSAAGATSAQFAVVGDSRALIYAPRPQGDVGATTTQAYIPYFAGDINSYRSGDAYSAMLTGNNTNNAFSHGSLFAYLTATDSATIMRKSHGVGSGIQVARQSFNTAAEVSGTNTMPLGPVSNTVDNTLRTARVLVGDGDDMRTAGVRGEAPGALYCLNSGVLSLFGASLVQTNGGGDMQGKKLLSIPVATNHGAAVGVGFVDITGPWRT